MINWEEKLFREQAVLRRSMSYLSANQMTAPHDLATIADEDVA